jgi:hypothetical protein
MRDLPPFTVEGICDACGATFEIRAPNQRYCADECRKERTRNQARTERRRLIRTQPSVFVGVDGEGIQGRCSRNEPGRGPCPCRRFKASAQDDNICRCGHHRYDDHEHIYVLLTVGDRQIENPDGLTVGQILAFLYECFEAQPHAAFVGFFLGYDFAQWLKGIPERKARLLITDEGRSERIMRRTRRPEGSPPVVQPVRVYEELGPEGGWELEWLPGKRLQLRPLTCECEIRPRSRSTTAKTRLRHCRCGARRRKPYMAICDVGSMFQASFLSVIDPDEWDSPVCTPDEYTLIAEGKEGRADAPLDDRMRRYNRLENELLARLMAAYEDGLRQLGITLGRREWYGPGAVAAKWLGRNGAPHRKVIEGDPLHQTSGVVPDKVRDAVNTAFLSGWFELFAHGTIPGDIWEYDIVSAYPYQIARLPCLMHGRWRHLRRKTLPEIDPATQLCLVHCPPGALIGSDPHIGPMLHRQPDGSICRPLRTGGWPWLHELQASRRAGLVERITIDECWVYDRCDCPPPLGVLGDLFDMRVRVGSKTPLGKAIKLIMNSIYGKFCQSVGTGPFRNYLYASLITAGTRAQILDAIATHPLCSNGVVMIATDAVYFTSPHPTLALCKTRVRPEPVLGHWEEEARHNLTLFKPGVYWDDQARDEIRAGRRPVFRARGIDHKAFAKHIDEIDALFADRVDGWIDGDVEGLLDVDRGHVVDWPRMTYRSDFGMVSPKQALARNRWDLAGRIEQPVSKQSSDPTRKRIAPYLDRELGAIRTRPRQQIENLESAPYLRPSVRAGLARVLDDSEPEPWDYESPDGPVGAIVAGMLGTGQWA